MEKFIVEVELKNRTYYFTGIVDGFVNCSTDITKAIIFEKFGRAIRKAKQISNDEFKFHVGKVSVNVRIS